MDLQTLISHISRKVQDASYTEALITAFINQGRRELAGEFYLPALRVSDTVTTSAEATSVALPDDYFRNLFLAHSAAMDRPIIVYDSREQMLHDWSRDFGESGQVRACCVTGANLDYLRSGADTLTLHYYTLPEDLADDTDEPTELPAHLHQNLLVGYACREIFMEIYEDEDTVAVKRHAGLYELAKAELRQFLGPYAKAPVKPNTRQLNWGAL